MSWHNGPDCLAARVHDRPLGTARGRQSAATDAVRRGRAAVPVVAGDPGLDNSVTNAGNRRAARRCSQVDAEDVGVPRIPVGAGNPVAEAIDVGPSNERGRSRAGVDPAGVSGSPVSEVHLGVPDRLLRPEGREPLLERHEVLHSGVRTLEREGVGMHGDDVEGPADRLECSQLLLTRGGPEAKKPRRGHNLS